MKIIGIVTRNQNSPDGHDIKIIYDKISKAIKMVGAIPMGLILEEDYRELIDLCDGLIFQGGDNIEEYDLKALKYAYDNNIPTLGICLGMQEMGILFNGSIKDILGHKKDVEYAHTVLINKDTKLYNIFNLNKIDVNSRHKSVLESTDLKVSALSSDGYIEAIEDSNKKFFIGIQWHPESLIYDNNQYKIFKEFIRSCY